MRALRAPAALLCAALVAACATPPVPGEAAWTSGRLNIRIAADAGRAAQSTSAAFELRGDGSAGELRLVSPLGTRMAQARWAPGLAALETPEGERRFASLDELSVQAFGEALPLAALPDWIAGRPWRGAAAERRDDGFEQLGWRVLLARLGDGVVEASRKAPPAVVVLVRLDRDDPR